MTETVDADFLLAVRQDMLRFARLQLRDDDGFLIKSATLLKKGLLYGMEGSAVSEALHRSYAGSIELGSEHKATVYGLPIHEDRARAAFPDPAAFLGAGEMQPFPYGV